MPTYRITGGVLSLAEQGSNYPDNTLPGIPGPVDPGYSPPWARPQPPLGMWGPNDPRPTHPIAGYPWPMPPGGGGPVDPGYSPPWARPGGGPVDPGYSPPWARPGGPVDPGYSPPWATPYPPYPDNALPGGQPYPDNTLPGYQPRPGHALPPFATNLPVIPPQQPAIDPVDPTKAHLVAYVPKADGSGYERITFIVDYPPVREPPTEAAPKPVG